MLIALALFAATAPATSAQPLAPSIAATRSAEARATELSDLMFPSDSMLAVNVRTWETAIRTRGRLDTTLSTLAKAHPGIIEAAITAARPMAREQLAQLVADMRSRRIRAFAERLTPAELDAALAFQKSGPGRRYVAGMLANLNPDIIADEAIAASLEAGRPAVSKEMTDKVQARASQRTHATLSAADQLALLRFVQTSAGQKVRQINQEMDRIALQLTNDPDPAYVERQNAVMQAAMLAFVDRSR